MTTNLPYNDEDLSEGETLQGHRPRPRDYDYDYDYGRYNDDNMSRDRSGGRGRSRDWDRDRNGDSVGVGADEYHPRYSNDRRDNRYRDRAGGGDPRGRQRDWDAPPSRNHTRSRSRSPAASRSQSRSYRSRSRTESGARSGSGSGSQGRRHRPRSYSGSRSRSPPPRISGPGYASDTVIVEGMPAGLSASELRTALLESAHLADYTDLEIRIPHSKGPRRAFVQFAHINDAADFVRENFPRFILELPGPMDEAPDGTVSVFIHYARRTDDIDGRPGVHVPNWICPECDFSNYPTRNRCKECGTPQSEAQPVITGRLQLTGESDSVLTPDVPTQILVIHPVSPTIDEARLAADLRWLEIEPRKEPKENTGKLKSTAPSSNTSGLGGRPGSLHRVFLMRDRSSDEPLRYAFAEFWTIRDAAAALDKFLKAPSALNVGGAPVTVAATHTGVFVPDDPNPAPEMEHFSFHPVFNPALRVRYWEPTVYPSAHVMAAESPDAPVSKDASGEAGMDNQQGGSGDPKKTKKRKADGSLAPASSAKKPAPMMNQMAMWQKKSAELRGGQKTGEDTNLGASGQRAPIKISLSTSAKLGAPAPSTGTLCRNSAEPAPAPVSAPPAATTDVSYIDRERLCCLLCMMKYKSLEDALQHERSRNHKTAMEDAAKVTAADERLVKRGLKPAVAKQVSVPEPEPEPAAPQYRDRAKERREVYNQPNRPSMINHVQGQSQSHSKTASASSIKPQAPAEPAAPAPPKASKGSSMLAKMGWTAGKGLGANGEGRTTAIETNAYQEGVGLGAEGGNLGDAAALAEKKTQNSYEQYVSTVQDKARERYARLP